jgi:hypothetical protein
MKFANEVGHYEIVFEDLGAIACQLDGAHPPHLARLSQLEAVDVRAD